MDRYCFLFLNLQYSFQTNNVAGPGVIDWNFSGNGKLWTYNLNYFDLLFQPKMTREEGVELMLDFADQYGIIKDGHEAYPSSLRIMNWIKFVSIHNIENERIDQVIHTDMLRLQQILEYHIMGNHLLENGFALLFGALYFEDPALLKKSESILMPQLKEQILSDGAHFELTPMYHQVLLSRILDSINLMSNDPSIDCRDLHSLLNNKGAQMLGWLLNITFSNGDIPHVNDSTNAIAPTTEALTAYAGLLDIKPPMDPLSACGYRKIDRGTYELVLDVGNIGPDYILGHAHSDTFNFVLYHNGQPLIVDTGISTYEKDHRRTSERSTAAHNTVMINDVEQSEVWSGFRVARRAKSTIIHEEQNSIVASHDGYSHLGIIHQRSFTYSYNGIIVHDSLSKASNAKAFLHFHPGIFVSISNKHINGTFGSIKIKGSNSIRTEKYQYALGFNKTSEAIVVVIGFTQRLDTFIQFA